MLTGNHQAGRISTWELVVTIVHNAEFFCGPGVKLGLCSAVDTCGIKEEQLKTPDYEVLCSYCLLVSEAVRS